MSSRFRTGWSSRPTTALLIFAESFAGRLTAFDIDDDGGLSKRRTRADGIAPDGICLDADDCIWTSTASDAKDCARVREGGEVLERIQLDRFCFATMLGGPDRRTLFMLAADWRGSENIDDVVAAQTGQILVADAPSPGVGWP